MKWLLHLMTDSPMGSACYTKAHWIHLMVLYFYFISYICQEIKLTERVRWACISHTDMFVLLFKLWCVKLKESVSAFPLNGIFSWVLSSLFYSGNINSMCWKNKMKGDVCVCMCACVCVSESITSGSLSIFFYFSGISHQLLKNNLMPWCNATPAGADWQTGFLLDILDAVCEAFIKLRYKNFIQEFICSNFSKRFGLGWS